MLTYLVCMHTYNKLYKHSPTSVSSLAVINVTGDQLSSDCLSINSVIYCFSVLYYMLIVVMCCYAFFVPTTLTIFRYHVQDIIVGKIYFLLVRLKLKLMELQIIRREKISAGELLENFSKYILELEYNIIVVMDGSNTLTIDDHCCMKTCCAFSLYRLQGYACLASWCSEMACIPVSLLVFIRNIVEQYFGKLEYSVKYSLQVNWVQPILI